MTILLQCYHVLRRIVQERIYLSSEGTAVLRLRFETKKVVFLMWSVLSVPSSATNSTRVCSYRRDRQDPLLLSSSHAPETKLWQRYSCQY